MPNKSKDRVLTYAEAILEGLDEAMAADPRVVVIGEGAPDPKAIFGTTKGLYEKYGADRVFDMPLSENGVTGICIGASMSGIRPVLIHQRIDFTLLSLDQIINNAAKWFYMFNGQTSIPFVVRMIVGRGWGQGPQHSQSLQGIFAAIPGIKVVMPSTPKDAKGMMISSIEDGNPVMFIEHRWLHGLKGVVPRGIYRSPLSGSQIEMKGSSITVATFSFMILEARLAAQALKSELGIEVELIDIRVLRPLDLALVHDSVSKTGRLLVLDMASKTGGFAAEIVSQIVERSFDSLKTPPVRMGFPDHPTPTSPYLSKGYYPDASSVAEMIMKMLGYSSKEEFARVSELLRKDSPHDVPDAEYLGPF